MGSNSVRWLHSDDFRLLGREGDEMDGLEFDRAEFQRRHPVIHFEYIARNNYYGFAASLEEGLLIFIPLADPSRALEQSIDLRYNEDRDGH